MMWTVHSAQNEDDLMHYGVLGMKWGVRRTPEQLGHHKIKKGTKMYRVSPDENDSNSSGSTYVTYLAPDRDMYRGAWTQNMRRNYGKASTDPIYETTYKLKEDLNIPSRDEYSKIVEELRQDKGKEFVKNLVIDCVRKDAYTEERWKELNRADGNTESDEQLSKVYKQMIGNMLRDYYKDFNEMTPDKFFRVTASRLGTSKVTKDEIISELSKRGYNAMVDEASVGGTTRKREGVEPIIIFDRGKSMEALKTKKVSALTEAFAKDRYMDWYQKANNPLFKKYPW